MNRKVVGMAGVVGLVAATAVAVHGPESVDPESAVPGRAVVFVRSQQLYYDSVVLNDLPPNGPFQVLEVVDGNLETDFGPGDTGYYGGRWALDMGGGETKYFLCPLIGKGHAAP